MSKKVITLVILVVVVIVLAIVLRGGESEREEAFSPVTEEVSTSPSDTSGLENVVTFTNDGFSPDVLTVGVGTAVVFRNQSSVSVWPASAIHPTHKLYPGSGIEKCGTSEEGSIFDACRGIVPGSSWSFTFDENGTWKYHNHLNPRNTGTIVVE